MSERALLIEARFIEGRYHGAKDWPPSPFRLFQALVAGAYGGRWAAEDPTAKDAPFRWLERLDPPHVAAPPKRDVARLALYVPNNDADARGGDPHAIGAIRVPKRLAPAVFAQDIPILYAWPFDTGEAEAEALCGFAERLHTLGLGLDAACARAEIMSWAEADARLLKNGGFVARPGRAEEDGPTCPTRGSLDSLKRRHEALGRRFRREGKGMTFGSAPWAVSREIAYDSPPLRLVFALLDGAGEPLAFPADRIVELTERIRDAACEKLERLMPDRAALVRNVVAGARDSTEADKAARIRITPLPSIGHRHADRGVRRVLVEAPVHCPLSARDLERGFAGLEFLSDDGEVLGELAAGADRGMLRHYGIDDGGLSRIWRTVTPAALPAARRRIEPARIHDRAEQKGGRERAAEERAAAGAAQAALRHAGVVDGVEAIRVQREPFDPKGVRAERFAAPPRFPKERLWHVEIAFAQARRGPLIVGDGRYLGLGLTAPAEAGAAVALFDLTATKPPLADAPDLARAVRRALMALARDPGGAVPTLFSGHEPDGRKAQSGRHRHVFLAAADLDGDGRIDRLIVAAPWACDRTAKAERGEKTAFDHVVSRLETVRAGRIGVIGLQRTPAGDDDPFLRPSRIWESAQPYLPTRHAGRRDDPADACARDLVLECLRRDFPRPEVEALDLSTGPNGGSVAARLRLRFAVAVAGPLLLGRNSHFGGGLFRAAPDAPTTGLT